jgi:DNA polymerase III delta subunit
MIWARTYLQDNIISTGRNMSDEEINQLAEKLQISEPFHTIHADRLGPLPESLNNHRYILVIINAFSKFCLLYLQSTLTAEETKQNLISVSDHWIFSFQISVRARGTNTSNPYNPR